MSQYLNIGLIGFGVVGQGLYEVLHLTKQLPVQIKKIAIKHIEKPRSADAALFTDNINELIDDPSIDIIVELIDDAHVAFDIFKQTLKAGKKLVSANKKMIADHLDEILEWKNRYPESFLYEAACAASIPVIRNLEEYYDYDLLQSVEGIINGSTNYILTQMIRNGIPFKEALIKAQEAGFAESDPFLDISGTDAANKLCILLLHAFGVLANPNQLIRQGINHLQAADIQFAQEKNLQLKLVARAFRKNANEVIAYVLPQFVSPDEPLSLVHNEYNGLIIETSFAEKQFFYGKGAGGYPTASAVLSDISALRYDYKYEYKKLSQLQKLELNKDYSLYIYLSSGSTEIIQKYWFEEVYTEIIQSSLHQVIGKIAIQSLLDHNLLNNDQLSVIHFPQYFAEKNIVTMVQQNATLK